MAADPDPPAAPPGRRVPDFFIVGTPKTGTTSLYQMLRRHPQIFMPALKEPRYLASDMRPLPRFAHEQRELGYPLSLDQYLALFDDASADQLAGEASAFYLWSQSAAQQIAELQPHARIIAILREPASFLRSLHLMYLQWRVESVKDLAQAIALEQARREGRRIPRQSHRPQLLQYSEHVRYTAQLHRYHKRFGRDHVRVLIHDDLRDDTESTVRAVLRFLEVDSELPVDELRVNVTTDSVRSWRAKELLSSVTKGQGALVRSARTGVKAVTTRQMRRAAATRFRRGVVLSAPPPADDELLLAMRRRFRPEVVALSEYLGRDLVALWGYDELG